MEDEPPYPTKLHAKVYEDELRLLQIEMLKVQRWVKEADQKVVVLFEGRDAAGKGGAIRRFTQNLNPRGARVVALPKPGEREGTQWYFQRYVPHLPAGGEIALFDRSWYGRVLVERVEGYATQEQWRRAFDEIVQFERALVLEGVIIVKFWLHISPDEQLKRFKSRQADPLRRWKLTDEDWRNRDKLAAYEAATEEMFDTTDHPLAPWHIVSGEQKRWARVTVIETLVERIEQGIERFQHPEWGDGFIGP